MSNPRGRSQAEQARLAAEQAAIRRRERRLLVVALVAFVVVLVGGGIGFQAWRTGRAATPVISADGSVTTPQTVTAGKPLVLGQADAPVTVTLYEDFHCPHCAELEEDLGPTLTAAQNAGQVKIELFPMSFIDAGSAAAANAMACAAEAGFAQSYYLSLFANHTLRWSDDQLTELAGKLTGGNPDGFAACVTGRAHASWVDSINATADQNGVTGTPTMFLDGQPVTIEGLTPESLQARIADAARN